MRQEINKSIFAYKEINKSIFAYIIKNFEFTMVI